jgi:hypothetical protein
MIDKEWEAQLKKWGEEMGEVQNNQFEDVFKKHLGYSGRMLSGSKSGYRDMYPTRVPIFNANICVKEYGKLWHGDIDVAIDEKDLIALATELKTTLYVFYESDARFEKSKNIDYNVAVFKIDALGCLPLKRITPYVIRDKGRWRLLTEKELKKKTSKGV